MLQRGNLFLRTPRKRDVLSFSVGATPFCCLSPRPANVYAVIEKFRPTLFFSVPTNVAMLLAHHREGADFDLSSIRHAVSAGEALPPPLFERFKQRFGVEILDGIGSTELLHIFISNRPGAVVRLQRSRRRLVRSAAVTKTTSRSPGEIVNLLIIAFACATYWNKHTEARNDRGHFYARVIVRRDGGYFCYSGAR